MVKTKECQGCGGCEGRCSQDVKCQNVIIVTSLVLRGFIEGVGEGRDGLLNVFDLNGKLVGGCLAVLGDGKVEGTLRDDHVSSLANGDTGFSPIKCVRQH